MKVRRPKRFMGMRGRPDRILVRQLRNFNHIRTEFEHKKNELESARDELKKQNVKLIKNSIELSDVMRQLEDKNYDLKRLHATLENQVRDRTEALREANRKLRDEIQKKARAQEALKESEEKYKFMFEHSGTGIFILEDDTTISMANAKCEEITGVPVSQMENVLSWTHFVEDPEARERMIGYHRVRRQNPDSAPSQYEFKLRHASGTLKDVIVHVTTIDSTGQSIASMIDITKRRQIAEEKQALEKQLQQAHKMEAIGTLAGGIAHDFNNILAVLMGNVGLAMNTLPKGSELYRWMDNSMKACMRARDLVLQILTFSRQNDHAMASIRIAPVINEAVRFLRSSIPTTILFDIAMECDWEQVMGNPTEIHQVMMNLCTNAAHAMAGKAGSLKIRLRPVSLDENSAMIISLSQGDYIELEVSDTGCGMDPEVIDHIFNPFFTTKKIGEGTGMGLAVTHGIIQRMGGSITVESVKNSGSVFRVYFPVNKGQEEEVGIEYPEITGEEELVLLVDDDVNVLAIMEEMVMYLGYRVESMSNGIEALQAFRAEPDRFDLVITDHTMPIITGIELSKRILATRPDIPIVLYTGYDKSVDLSEARRLGISEILTKPIEPRQLSQVVHKVLGVCRREQGQACPADS